MKTGNILIALAFTFFANMAYAGDMMSGDQIKALMSNKTYDVDKLNARNKNKKYFSAYAAEDGTRLLDLPWKGGINERKWWVDGDGLCGSHPKKGDYCREVKDMGDGMYHIFEDGEAIRAFSNFRDGNQL